jgi:hypothetical protein
MARQRAKHAERRANGDCSECGKPSGGRSRCVRCSELRRRRRSRGAAARAKEAGRRLVHEKRMARKYRAAGLCIRCGRRPTGPDGTPLCQTHRDQQDRYNAAALLRQKAARAARRAALELRFGKITTARAAEMVGVSCERISELCRRGVLPHGRASGTRLMHVYDVLRYKAWRDARPDKQRNRKPAP